MPAVCALPILDLSRKAAKSVKTVSPGRHAWMSGKHTAQKRNQHKSPIQLADQAPLGRHIELDLGTIHRNASRIDH